MISRGRKYAGMAGVPLPLSLNDIELYLASRTILIDRIEFDAAILALDDVCRAEWAEEQKKAGDSEIALSLFSCAYMLGCFRL
ncbi:hypothetical protein LOF14_27690 [Klebsiella variicola subsp. variicola]|nr:hypothetical protein LOF14_27690 [Klebsiella variicola subsp. variicola]